MSEETEMKRDGAMLAAEFALGLLEGEELLAARGRMASDDAFAAEVAQWEARLAPLLDEVAPLVPSAELWAQIEARVAAAKAARSEFEGGGGPASNVIDLQSRLRRWQWTAGLTSAAAAIALAFVAFAPSSNPVEGPGGTESPTPQMASADPLVAQVPIGDTGLRLDVTYIPESDKMLVAAIGLTPDGVHDHELWLVPKDGSELQSLGVVAPGEVRSMELPDEIARNLGDGVELVLTREPIGGKPEGVDAGPVVAQGEFSQV
ncbi:anti-sigma factor domain-containing protein [Erythrobacter sp. THAF29]|uniref:anti-sigma factor n=1 Tax=Erythrobacter sp. THAF29 TaxID=2587851 RepID=UPI0012686923|nr:anti-sigma factor [Erythrobacter sp. THAF29]QFT76954.1 Anti-sigma-K factor rskA [Erythrobacter sp. THAF29]